MHGLVIEDVFEFYNVGADIAYDGWLCFDYPIDRRGFYISNFKYFFEVYDANSNEMYIEGLFY